MSDLRKASDDLVAACRDFLGHTIRGSNDPHLPPDTSVDEYITMLSAYPRSVRRSLKGAPASMVAICQAIRDVELAAKADATGAKADGGAS